MDDVAIVICSCDAYSDTWPYIAESWDRYWPDCPFPVYLVSELETFSHSRIQNVRLGRLLGWSDMLIETLPRITQNHIIYLQDDYLLKGATDSQGLAEMLEAFSALDADYLRLFPWPTAASPLSDYPGIGPVNVDEPYRTSLQAAVWRKTVLEKLLQPGESGHQFEERSPGRAAVEHYRFFSVYDPDVSFGTMNERRYVIDYYATAIFQGKWLGDALRTLGDNGISIDPSPRGILNRWDYWYFTKSQGAPVGARAGLLRLVDRWVFKQAPINSFLTQVMLRRWKLTGWLDPVSDDVAGRSA